MKKIKNAFLGLLALAVASPVLAQFAPGQVLTAAQLNSAFANVLPIAGGTLTGPLTVPTLTVTSAPIAISSGGTGATTATGATGQLQYLQGASGSVARSLTNKFQDTLNLKDFGGPNTCNGTNNDDAAMTAAFAAIVPGVTLTLPAGTCTFTTAKTLPLISNGGIRGAGSGQTTLLYTGTNTTNDLISLGNGTASIVGWNLSGFTIQSATTMTAGSALHLRRLQAGNSLYDVNAGALNQASIKLYDGVWLDNVNVLKYQSFNIQVQNQGLKMNGAASSDEGSDIFLDDGVITFSNIGYHVGGGQGGVYFGKVLAYGNGTNYQIDNGLVSRLNREIFFSDMSVSDGSYGYGVWINDTLTSNAPIVMNGAFGSAGVLGGGPNGVEVYVQKWPNGRITFGAGQLYNATKDGLKVDDASTIISIDPARHIFNNGGYGVNATVATSNIYNASQYMALNVLGNQSANVNTPTWAIPTAVVNGGTGAATAAAARTNLGAAASASPVFSGVSSFNGNVALYYTAPAQSAIQWLASSSPRWQWFTDGSAETGANAGSNMALGAYSDAGAYLGTYATFTRATGALTLSGSISHGAQEVDKSYTYSTPATGTTVTLASGTQTAIINPGGTLSTLTVTLPGCTSAYDGSLARYSSTQAVTTLTVNASSGTVSNAPTTVAAGGGAKFLCRGANTTWYPVF